MTKQNKTSSQVMSYQSTLMSLKATGRVNNVHYSRAFGLLMSLIYGHLPQCDSSAPRPLSQSERAIAEAKLSDALMLLAGGAS